MCAPILEHEPRARDQILYGVGYEDFSRAGEPSNSCSDVNGNAGELRPYDFALTGVKTRANVEAHQPDLIADRLSSPNGASWAIEGCEEPVTCGVDFLPVARRQFAPLPVTECGRPLRRAHDVGK